MHEGREKVIARCISLSRELLGEHLANSNRLLGIGIAFSGVIDVEAGVVLSFPRPGLIHHWRHVPLKAIFEDAFGVPSYLEDSVRAIATIEKHYGKGLSLSDFVYVDVGMGVGASIFIGGKLYRGFGGGAGEFGHIAVDENGPACCCGSNGCLEAMASSSAIIESVRSRLELGAPSNIYEMLDGRFADVSLEVIARAAEAGDNVALRGLVDAGAHIGAATANLINLLNPEAIIFGGGLFRAEPGLLLESIQRSVRHRAMEKATKDVQLVLSDLGSEAGALGAAHLSAERSLLELFQRNSGGPAVQ